VVVEGLTQIINREDDLVVCARAGNAKEALEAIGRDTVDLAVVDMLLENTTGVQVTASLKAKCKRLYVLILSMSDEPRYIKRAFQAGARGYITKDDAAEGIVDAIRQVRDGKVYVSRLLTKKFSSKAMGKILVGDFGDGVWEY
jgi:DNA-binding NarL/FixJ family response regulator